MVNNVHVADKKCAILLSVCDAVSYCLIRDLIAPTEQIDKSFAK